MRATALLDCAHRGLSTGTPDVEELYSLAKRHGWNAADFPWEAMDFSPIPIELRQGLSEMLAQIHYGELGALAASTRLVQSADGLFDRLFGATQVSDEARHVEWFSRLLHHVGAPAPVVPAVRDFIDDVTQEGDEVALLVGMNLLIEGVAQTLVLEAGGVLASLELEPLAPLKEVGAWLVQRVALDESRHLAFGVARVGALVGTLSPERRAALQTRVAAWAERLFRLTEERSRATAAFGVDGDALMARCERETRSRLSRVGLGL